MILSFHPDADVEQRKRMINAAVESFAPFRFASIEVFVLGEFMHYSGSFLQLTLATEVWIDLELLQP